MFAAVVKPMGYKYLFEVGLKRSYRICHMDIVTTFLYAIFEENVIYVNQSYLFATKLKKIYVT